MTSHIVIGEFKPVKSHSFSCNRSVNEYIDTATVKIPAMVRFASTGTDHQIVPTGQVIKEGMKVGIMAGYNGDVVTRFLGFVRRVNSTIPVELECEGYSYQLSSIEGYTKSYASVTVKKLLSDLVQGTDIKLSPDIPDIPLKNIYFKNVKGTDVLEYLKDKCLLTVYFDFDVLYAGLQMTQMKGKRNFRLGWNVIKDNELKFETSKQLSKVNIQIESRDKTGTKKKGKTNVKDGSVKTMKIRHIYDEALLKKIAAQQREKLVYSGYKGKITAFLVPAVSPGMGADITDPKFSERQGLYFIEGVQMEFGPSGGRQKISIGAAL